MSDTHNESPDPRSLLPSLSRAELERIIAQRLDEGDDDLGELVLALEAEKTGVRSPSAIVAGLLRRYKNRGYDCIDDVCGFALGLRRLWGRAEEAASKGEGLFAIRLITRSVECAAPHTFEGDDEESPIMDAVNEGFERLSEIARAADADPKALRELGAWAARGVDAK